MTPREIYALTGRHLKNFRKFYNTYKDRYGILSADEELEPDIELAIMVEAGIYNILDVIRALSDDDYVPDPPKQTATIIDFEKEQKARKNEIISEQYNEICALKSEISRFKQIPTVGGITILQKSDNEIPTMRGIIAKNLEKELKDTEYKIKIFKNPKIVSKLKEYRAKLKSKLIR